MRRFRVLLLILVIMGMTFSANALNVKDFGAKGDGVADDSDAIQDAIQTGRKDRKRELVGACPVGISDQAPIIGVGEETDIPEIFLPAGKYRLTKTLVATGFTNFRGEPGTILIMDNADADILYFHWAFRNRVENIEFRGGKNQLLVCTCNNESARIIIQNCRFVNAGKAGIDCNSYRRPGGTDYRTNPLPAYEVKWENDKPILTPNDLSNKDSYNNSTLFVCSDSVFFRCHTAVNCGADGVTIRDCRVEETGKGIPFIFGASYSGPTRIYRTVGVASDNSSGVWVSNNTSNLAIRDCSFSGKPMRLVKHLFQGKTNIPSSLIISNTKIAAGPVLVSIDNSRKENTPSMIDIEKVENTSDGTVPIFSWNVTPDVKRLTEGRHVDNPALEAYHASLVEWPYQILLAENSGFVENLPAALKSHASAVSRRRRAILCVTRARIIADRNVDNSLRAVDFGVDLDDTTDDTAGMQKCLAAAAELQGVTEIELPTVRVTISDTLELPPESVLTAFGQAQIKQTTPERPIFRGTKTAYLKVENLTLNGGGIGFDIQAEPTAELKFSTLGVYSLSFAGIRVRAGEDNKCRLLLQNSTFLSARQVLDSDAAAAEVNNIWITSYGKMDDQAVIINRAGGRMLIADILTVPGIMKYHYPPHLPYVKDWPYSNNLRWVDNYGRLELLDNRFGGEWMGFCIVYNRDPRATLFCDGGVTCFFSEWSKKCLLYCEFPPKYAIMKNVGWRMKFPDSELVMQPEYATKKPDVSRTNTAD